MERQKGRRDAGFRPCLLSFSPTDPTVRSLSPRYPRFFGLLPSSTSTSPLPLIRDLRIASSHPHETPTSEQLFNLAAIPSPSFRLIVCPVVSKHSFRKNVFFPAVPLRVTRQVDASHLSPLKLSFEDSRDSDDRLVCVSKRENRNCTQEFLSR